MPPSLVASPDDKAGCQPSPDADDRRRPQALERRLPPSSPSPDEAATASRARKSYSAHSVSSSSASSPAARPSDDKSFARDFFDSSKRKLRRSFFSKRGLRFDDGADDSDGSADSLRDPLNLPSVILKRREGDGGGRRETHPPLMQTNSEKTFDFDYTNLERKFYQRAVRVEERRRWVDDEEEEEEEKEKEERNRQPQQQPHKEAQSIHLETLQEHVMRRRGQHGSAEFRQEPSLPVTHVAAPTVTWAPAPSTTITQQQQHKQQQQQQQEQDEQQQGEDDASWLHDVMRTKNAMEEALAELQQFRPQDDGQQYHHREEPYEGRRVQGQRPQHPDGLHPDSNSRQQPQHQQRQQQQPQRQQQQPQRQQQQPQRQQQQPQRQQQQPQRQQQQPQRQQQERYPGSLRNLTTTYRPATTSEMAWEEESLMDDILRATDVRGRNGELLSRNEVLEEMGILPPKARENGENDGRARECSRQQQHRPQHELPPWQEPQKPPTHEQPREQEQERWLPQNKSQHERGTSKLQSVPDDQTWIQEVLYTSNKQGYSANIIKDLLESVSRECKEDESILSSLQQNEDNCFRDRNSIETWMEDVQRSPNVCPVVLQELMEARSGSGSGSGSAHHTSSDTSRNNIYPTKPKQHSTVIQDMRGPVPTDDMLAESLMSHEGSESTGSRILGENVLIVSRKNRENQSDDIPLDILEAMGISDDSLVKDVGVKQQAGRSKISSPQTSLTGDEITAEDVLAQIGPGVDYESIPDDVLAALGISKRQLRKAESIDVKPSLNSGNDVAPSAANRNVVSSSPEQPDKFFQRSKPDDDVSWAENVPNLSKIVHTAPARACCDSSHTDSITSSQKEIATDELGPIPEADMLEEAFSGSSRTESHTGSLRSLREVVQMHGCKENDSSEEGDRQHVEPCLVQSPPEEDDDLCGAIKEMKPSLGFMRHRHVRYGTYDSGLDCRHISQNDLELEAMKKRSDVLASIEQARSKLKRKQQERQQNHD